MRRALLPALVAAAGYALLELAFFAPRNLILPWRPSHFALFLQFFGLHAVVALASAGVGALVARAALRPLAGTLPAFASIAGLVAVHGLTWYRERVNSLPRDLEGTSITLGIVAGAGAVAVLAAWAFRCRPALGARAATGVAAAIVVLGLGRVVTAEPPGAADPVRPRPASEPLVADPSGQRVLVFGFDGATWDVLDPLIAAGRLPNLAALAARGRTFALETFRPTFSPVIWTSVSTGKDRFAHGIHDVVQTRLPGGTLVPRAVERMSFLTKTVGVPYRALGEAGAFRLAPYRSEQIRATSVFEAASEAGFSVSCIEWYVSWPARPLSGVVVSDRFHLQTADTPAMPKVVLPEALAPVLRHHVVTHDDVPLARIRALVDDTGLDDAGWEAWTGEHERFVDEMRYNLARDLTTRNVAVDLLSRDRSWDLFGVYFRAVDLSHHLTWGNYRKGGGEPGSDLDARLAPVVERYHEVMDGIVGEVLAEVPDDAIVLLLSDHGFEDRWAHSRAPDGIAIAAGGAIVPTGERGRLGVFEVAPTVAMLLGLPVPDDLNGQPRTDLVSREFRIAHPVRGVSTWERADRDDAETAPDDEGVRAAEIERLRALGYIQ